jgi:hypothetical protein
VELVVKLRVARKRPLEKLADVFVAERAGFAVADGVERVAVAFEDAAGVGVDDEDRMAGGIEEDGVGGFGTDAVDGEKLRAKGLRLGARHFRDRALVRGVEEADKGFQLFGFLAEVAGRANEFFKVWRRGRFDGARREELFAAQVFDGGLDVGPRSVLNEDGPYDDLEPSAAGPPVLRAVGGEQGIVVEAQWCRIGKCGGVWLGRHRCLVCTISGA